MPTRMMTNTPETRFADERSRLLAALGEMTEGGIVEDIQHVGITSVPGLADSACVNIALSVWPFPLEAPRVAALQSLGYAPVAGYEGEPVQRFARAAGDYQLHVVALGSEQWLDPLILRDYLRADDAARHAYAGADEAQRDRHFLAAARPWWVQRRGFTPVEEVAQELQGFDHSWYISSGWALDLFLGRVTRAHFDVDVVVARADQLDLQQHMAAHGWKFVTPLKARLEPWPVHMRMEMPRHQAHAHRDGAFIDFLLTDIEHGVWRYRRDRTIVQAVERIGLRSEAGIPYLAPELALLFKAKNASSTTRDRPKDEDDFANVLPRLSPERRAWLTWALLATDPTHPWIAKLTPSPGGARSAGLG
jgi:GrpB-like predicted nucleotidyltransferase (UPF0157 family)